MIKRTIWGILAAALAILVILAGHWIYALTIAVLTVLAVFEYVELLKKQNFRPQTEVILLGSLLLILLVFGKFLPAPGLAAYQKHMNIQSCFTFILMLVFFTTLLLELFRGNPDQGLVNAAVNLFGTVYIGFMFAYILLLRFIPNGFFYLFLMLPDQGYCLSLQKHPLIHSLTL